MIYKRWMRILSLCMVFVIVMTGAVGCARKPQVASAEYCPNGKSHEFHMETTQADCTQRGYTTGICQNCGYSYMSNMVNALGHQWTEPVSVKEVSCTQDGLRSKSCSRCGITLEEPLVHAGHSYVVYSAEGDGDQETVVYVCTICGDQITRNWDETAHLNLQEKTFLPDCSQDFTFLVSCDQGEDYLRNNLKLTGESGSVAYRITTEQDGIYRIIATEPYVAYHTYRVDLAEGMLFPEYNVKALEFSIVGPDHAEVEFNADNLAFLKAVELQQYGTSGLYELQWDEAAQHYYLTLEKLENIDPSMIGKVIGIGDYTSTEEILADSTRELCFAKLERISHDADGKLLLELSVPQLSEVYDKLDLYFAGNTTDMQVRGDPETAFMSAVANSEGFAEYLTATHLAAESYAGDRGLVAMPLAANSKDNLKFKLTKHSLTNTGNSNECKLELGGEITYTIPLKTKAGQASGSIVMRCNAEITATISAGGHFKDKESVNLYLTNETKTTLGFEMEFNLEYSQGCEEQYLLNKNTQKIHTATCRIANKETNPANLQKLSAQELVEWYHGDKAVMKQHECKVCMAVTGLDGTAYAYNRNTGVLHCMNCRHVADIKDCNLYTLYPDNTLSFTTCGDCRPQDRQVEDFDNRMLNAIKGSDWADQVAEYQEMLEESMGKKKPAPETDANLTVPINVAGVLNIELGVAPVFEFDMEASANFIITGSTTNKYGIRSVGKGFETYSSETPGDVNYRLSFTGEATAKFGIMMQVKAYPVGCEDFAYIAINGQVGLYGHFTGIFAVEGTVGADADAFCAARLDAGLYARMDGYWKILWFDGNFQILKEQRLPLFKWGYDRMYYAFEDEQIELTVDDPDEFVMFDISTLMKAKYLDLTTMEYKTGTISPVSKSRLNVTVEILNEDGSACDYLEYIPKNGMIHKKENAPRNFSVVITVQVTPKILIDSIADFLASETDNLVYGYSMDPLVIDLKVEEKTELPQMNLYEDILSMYHAGISSKWTNRDGEGWDTVGDPDNVCYILWAYEADRSLEEVGYAMIDINDDGQPELFISFIDEDESGSFYDMYTIIDGKVNHIISAGERDWYYLAADHSINNRGSGGAMNSSYENYRLDSSGKLRLNQAVILDGHRDSENPWFYATTEYYNSETYETNYDLLKPISEAEADALKDSFPGAVALELIPFSKYVPSSAGVADRDPAGAYHETLRAFIDQKQYQAVWDKEFGGSGILPKEYALFDLDQDGDEEVLVCGYEYGRTWARFLLFTYSTAENEFVHVPIEVSEIEEPFNGYCYLIDRYSPEHHSLVIWPYNNGAQFDMCVFWAMENGVLKSVLSVGWDTDNDGKYFFVNGERCTEETKDQYLNKGTVFFDFVPLS